MGEAWAYVTHQPPDAWAAVLKPAGCVQLAEVAGDPFAVGPWCWVLRNPRAIRPVPWKGHVSFFEVPDGPF